MEINNSGSSNYSFDRYVFLKSTFMATVLSALSYGVHCALKQRNLPHLTNALQQHCALATLAAITFVGSAVLFGRRLTNEVSGNDGKKDKKQEREISFQQIPEGKYQEVYGKLNDAAVNYVSLQIETDTELLTLTIQDRAEALVFLKEKLGIKDGQHSPAGNSSNNVSTTPKPKPKPKGKQTGQKKDGQPPVGTTPSNGNPQKVPSKSKTGTSSTYSHSSSSTYPMSRPAKMPEGVRKARREGQTKLKEKESPKNDDFCGFEDTWQDPARLDRDIKVEPAEYQEKVHGLNGEKMREQRI